MGNQVISIKYMGNQVISIKMWATKLLVLRYEQPSYQYQVYGQPSYNLKNDYISSSRGNLCLILNKIKPCDKVVIFNRYTERYVHKVYF